MAHAHTARRPPTASLAGKQTRYRAGGDVGAALQSADFGKQVASPQRQVTHQAQVRPGGLGAVTTSLKTPEVNTAQLGTKVGVEHTAGVSVVGDVALGATKAAPCARDASIGLRRRGWSLLIHGSSPCGMESARLVPRSDSKPMTDARPDPVRQQSSQQHEGFIEQAPQRGGLPWLAAGAKPVNAQRRVLPWPLPRLKPGCLPCESRPDAATRAPPK